MDTPVDTRSADEQALATMLAHHAELRGTLDERVTALHPHATAPSTRPGFPP